MLILLIKIYVPDNRQDTIGVYDFFVSTLHS